MAGPDPATDPNRALLTAAMTNDVAAKIAKAQFNASNLVGKVPVVNLPIATNAAAGIVKPDAVKITVNGTGTITTVA